MSRPLLVICENKQVLPYHLQRTLYDRCEEEIKQDFLKTHTEEELKTLKITLSLKIEMLKEDKKRKSPTSDGFPKWHDIVPAAKSLSSIVKTQKTLIIESVNSHNFKAAVEAFDALRAVLSSMVMTFGLHSPFNKWFLSIIEKFEVCAFSSFISKSWLKCVDFIAPESLQICELIKQNIPVSMDGAVPVEVQQEHKRKAAQQAADARKSQKRTIYETTIASQSDEDEEEDPELIKALEEEEESMIKNGTLNQPPAKRPEPELVATTSQVMPPQE